ncbi:MAG: leucine-rich repeat protein [Treponema sp.]|nr:leucine-rich repeat protein [Treponema sp.]
MTVKCQCGKKNEVSVIKKSEQIKINCPVCGCENILEYSEFLHKKYIISKIFDYFLFGILILTCIVLMYLIIFPLKYSWSFSIPIICIIVSLWYNKTALRITVPIILFLVVFIILGLYTPIFVPKYNSKKDFTFFERNGKITVLSYIGKSEVVSIPPKVNIPPKIFKIPVTIIGDSAFKGDTQFVLLYQKAQEMNRLPGGRLGVTPTMFDKIRNNIITTIKLPDTIEIIGKEAFAYTTSLTSINIPNSVITIEDRAFQESSISTIIIPNSVRSIGKEAFVGNTFYKSMIKDSPYIGNKLTSITIGSNVALENSFENGFDDFYNQNGCKAGTYTYSNEQWKFE